MRSVKRIIAILGVALATIGAAQAQELTGDVWSVCGFDGQLTWHDTRLVFTEQTERAGAIEVEGHFDWRSSAGHAGRELFTGQIKRDGVVELQGYEIDGSGGLVTSRYVARLADTGTAIVEGIWLDGAPGVWAAIRDGGAESGEALCGGEVEVVS